METKTKTHKSLILAKEIVAKAKQKFPYNVCVRGRLTPEEREVIEKECCIATSAFAYMDGSKLYYVRWDKKRANEKRK